MTDRLTPPQLRDLADILRHHGLIGQALEIAAARREAEAKPCDHMFEVTSGGQACKHCGLSAHEYQKQELGRTGAERATLAPARCPPIVGREGPGSADAPKLVLEAGKFYRTRGGRKVGPANLPRDGGVEFPWNVDGYWYSPTGVFATAREPPTEDDIVAEWVEDKPAPAADDVSAIAHPLRSVVTVDHSWPPMALAIIRRYEADRHNAASTIEAQAREIAVWRSTADGLQNERDALKARVARLAEQLSVTAEALGVMNRRTGIIIVSDEATRTRYDISLILKNSRAALAEAPDAG